MNTLGNLGGLVGPLVVGFAVERLASWTFPFYITARSTRAARSHGSRSTRRRRSELGMMNVGMSEVRTLLRDYRHCSQRRAGATFDLHRQRDDERAARGQAIEIRQVLERRDVALVQDAVRLVQRRLPVVDARRVEADGLDSPRSREPFRGVGVQTGEMQLRDRRLAALGRAEITRGVGPEA